MCSDKNLLTFSFNICDIHLSQNLLKSKKTDLLNLPVDQEKKNEIYFSSSSNEFLEGKIAAPRSKPMLPEKKISPDEFDRDRQVTE